MASVFIDRGFGFKTDFLLEKGDGTAEDLAGGVATWKIAASAGATEALITKISPDGITLSTVAGQSIAVLALSSVETEALAAGQYYHQLAFEPEGREPDLYFKGYLHVLERL